MLEAVRAARADLEQLLELAAARRREYARYQPRFWRPSTDAVKRQGDFFAALMDRDDALLVVARDGSAVRGFAVARLAEAPPVYEPGGPTCAVDDFAVADARDWATVGPLLLGAVRSWGSDRGAVQLVVVVAHLDHPQRDMLREARLEPASEWWVAPTAGDATGVASTHEDEEVDVDDGIDAESGDESSDGWFPESVAAGYDAPGGENAPGAVEPVVNMLAELAGAGPVLELAVGTGRIAAPLAARGLTVAGIELSRAMAARIAGKPGGDAVEVTIGDMTSTRVPGEFALVYLVFNTISNVTTQEGQVAVFRNAAAHLRPGGLFVIEVGIPSLRRLPPGQDKVPFAVAPTADGGGYVGFDQYDVVTQRFTSNHVTVSPDGSGQFRRIPFRYAWPAELDLMARLAGLTRRHRWADWDRSELTPESTKHVSVWARD